MLRSLKAMVSYAIEATDGQIGRAQDFLFEDDTWEIRYLVVDTGNWLPGRKVLIPVRELKEVDWRNESFPVPHTREEVQNGPGIDTDAPVNRQMEAQLHEHFRWMPYWAETGLATPALAPMAPMGLADPATPEMLNANHPPVQEYQDADPHLQSFNDALSFHVQHGEDDLGRVSDFIFDDEHWEIVSIIFDTGHFMRGKVIQVPAERVLGVFPDEGKVTVDMTKEETEVCPAFNLMKLTQDQLHPDERVNIGAGNVTDQHVQ